MPRNESMLKFSKYTYLDNNSTTKVSDSVCESMMPFLGIQLGNPSSNTSIGRTAKKAIDNARKQIAKEIDADPKEIYFTSCGSESNSWAIHSCVNQPQAASKQIIITTPVEHDSVRENLEYLKENHKFEIFQLSIKNNGELDLSNLASLDFNNVLFASLMLVNNELGTIYQEEIKQLRKILPPEIPIHCDAIQALGKLKFSVKDLGVEFLSLSGHKIHAPKGVGVLYVKNGQAASPLIWGHQERSQRGGTENVAYIVGFGIATEESYATTSDGETFEDRMKRITKMRDYIETSASEINGVIFNAKSSLRVANTANIGFVEIDAIKLALLLEQRGIFISNGAACNEIDPQHSHVLKAIDSPAYENGAIRISLSNDNTQYDAEYFVENLRFCISKLRGEK